MLNNHPVQQQQTTVQMDLLYRDMSNHTDDTIWCLPVCRIYVQCRIGLQYVKGNHDHMQ